MSQLNPFSTRYIRPGAIAYLFADGHSAETIVGLLEEQGWWGQIVGPHGSGKSTLLAVLLPALEAAGRDVVTVSLHRGEHRMPALDRELSSNSQIVIDGYEQLSWFSQRRIKSLCRKTDCGLLVTAHRNMRLPMIYETRSSEQLAFSVVARLLPGENRVIDDAAITAAYQVTRGNIRETLFRLYDVYQQRAATTATSTRSSPTSHISQNQTSSDLSK